MLGLKADKTPFLMHKHTLKYQVSQATTLPTTLGGSEKKIKKNKRKRKEKLIPLQVRELLHFLYYSKVYFNSLSDQLMDQQYHPCECMWGL